MYEQLDIFSFLNIPQNEIQSQNRLSVGDYVGRLVLGEVEIGKIYEVEGNGTHIFYRTNLGCFNADARTDFEQMQREAEEIRKQYKTIEIDRFDQFFAIEYPPTHVDDVALCAMVGIYKDMLFWKEDITYQFLEKSKNLKKAYKDKVFKITHNWHGEEFKYKVLDKPIPIHRLYWSKEGFYADARYVEANG